MTMWTKQALLKVTSLYLQLVSFQSKEILQNTVYVTLKYGGCLSLVHFIERPTYDFLTKRRETICTNCIKSKVVFVFQKSVNQAVPPHFTREDFTLVYIITIISNTLKLSISTMLIFILALVVFTPMFSSDLCIWKIIAKFSVSLMQVQSQTRTSRWNACSLEVCCIFLHTICELKFMNYILQVTKKSS